MTQCCCRSSSYCSVTVITLDRDPSVECWLNEHHGDRLFSHWVCRDNTPTRVFGSFLNIFCLNSNIAEQIPQVSSGIESVDTSALLLSRHFA